MNKAETNIFVLKFICLKNLEIKANFWIRMQACQGWNKKKKKSFKLKLSSTSINHNKSYV